MIDDLLIANLKRLTSINHHIEARILLARALDARSITGAFEGVKAIHELYGFMPPALNDVRHELETKLMDHAKRVLLPDMYQAIHDAL